MKHGFIKVAAATPRVTVADCKANGEEILKAIHEMEKEHVKLMVFPEFCITGYTCHDLFLQRCLLDSAWDELLHIADETKETDALIFVGVPLRHRGKLYNVAAALNHGRIVGFVPKTHIPNYNEFYEQRQFAGAEEEDVEFVDFLKGVKNEEDEFWDEIPFGTELIFECEEFPEFTVAAELCEDLWVPAPPSIRHAINGAHIIVNLSASDEMVGKDSYRRTLVSGQSARLICGYIYASAGEGESTQDLVFGGQNMIAENGSMLAESRRFENGIIYSEIDVQRLTDERRRMSTYPAVSTCSHTRVGFSVAEEETRLTRKYPQYPFVPSVKEERDERCEEILNIQAMGLKKRMEHIHSRSAVVGLSGGLDSTLALLVMARAFDRMGMPRDQIHCVTMPCFGTTDRTYQNACLARDSLIEKGYDAKRFHLVDSLRLSSGTAHLLLRAADIVENGGTAQQAEDDMRATLPRLSTHFIVDTLQYLHMGGRCSSIAFLAGSMLKLHPQINMIDGAMIAGEKFRGKLDRCIAQYEKKTVFDILDQIEPERIFLTHTLPDGPVEALAEEIRREVLAAHVGTEDEVLLETPLSETLFTGYTRLYIPVVVSAPGHKSGEIVHVRLGEYDGKRVRAALC